MVMELLTGGELFDKIAADGAMSENKARKVFQQLLDALDYCHQEGVFHRDLKVTAWLIWQLPVRNNIPCSDLRGPKPRLFGEPSDTTPWTAVGICDTSFASDAW